jgi:hypothetical protein
MLEKYGAKEIEDAKGMPLSFPIGLELIRE